MLRLRASGWSAGRTRYSGSSSSSTSSSPSIEYDSASAPSKITASSSSPARSCGSASSGSASVMLSSTAGWRERYAAIAGGISVAAADSNAARRSAAAAQAGDRLELGLRLGQPGEDRVGVACTSARARVGQPHAARAALDERGAGLALERRDLLGDRGLGERQGLGRGGEGAADGHLAQDAHSAYVKHQVDLYQPIQMFICADGRRPASCCSQTESPRRFKETPWPSTTFIQPSRSGPPAAPTASRCRASPQLDSKRPLVGDILVAERDGEIAAAFSLTSGAHVADPFRPTAELVALLRTARPPRSSPPARAMHAGGAAGGCRRRCAPREAFPLLLRLTDGGRRSPDAGRRSRSSGRPAGRSGRHRPPAGHSEWPLGGALAGVGGPRHRLRGLGLDLPRHPRRGRDDAADARRRPRASSPRARSCSRSSPRAAASRPSGPRGASCRSAAIVGTLLMGANAVISVAELHVPSGRGGADRRLGARCG